MRFRDFHINIKIRVIQTFMSSFVSGMIFPFMTIYLASNFGSQKTGVLLLINVLVGVLMSLIGGYFSDRIGRKKLMVWAELLRFIAFFIMMLSNSPWFESPLITFLMMTVNSICWGISGPVNQAMLLDVSSPEQRKTMYSITYWANNFSIAAGGILGGFLFKDYLFELFLALTFVAAVIVILVTFFIKESHVPDVQAIKATQHFSELLKVYKNTLKDKLFVLFVLAGVLIFSLEMQLTNYIGIKLTEEVPLQSFFIWEIDGVNLLGILRAENTILVVLLMLFTARIYKLIKDKKILIISCTIFSLGYGIVSYTNNVGILLIFMAILTIGEVLRIPIEQSYMASIPPDKLRSSYMAIYSLKYNLALSIASVTVFLGAFLKNETMSILITLIGLGGTYIYFSIIPQIESRKNENKNSK